MGIHGIHIFRFTGRDVTSRFTSQPRNCMMITRSNARCQSRQPHVVMFWYNIVVRCDHEGPSEAWETWLPKGTISSCIIIIIIGSIVIIAERNNNHKSCHSQHWSSPLSSNRRTFHTLSIIFGTKDGTAQKTSQQPIPNDHGHHNGAPWRPRPITLGHLGDCHHVGTFNGTTTLPVFQTLKQVISPVKHTKKRIEAAWKNRHQKRIKKRCFPGETIPGVGGNFPGSLSLCCYGKKYVGFFSRSIWVGEAEESYLKQIGCLKFNDLI